MIDGEIYTILRETRVVFAYRETSSRENPHYIGVNSYDEVKRYGDGRTVGEMGSGETRLANEGEIERFTSLLADNDYHWNKANKKVIRISTGEIL